MGKVMMLRKADRQALPPLYANDGKGHEAVAPVKFFGIGNMSAWTWYATEFDGEDTFFGLITNSRESWLGYFSLRELESFTWWGVPAVERDRHWRPQKLSEIRA